MKRFSLVLMMLCALTAFTFADAEGVALSGESTFQWGIDFDTNYSGFKASVDSLQMEFRGEADLTNEDESQDFYGYIEIEELEILANLPLSGLTKNSDGKYESKNVADAFAISFSGVTAEVKLKDFYLGGYVASDDSMNNASAIYNKGAYDVKGAFAPAATYGGMYFGYGNDGVLDDIKLSVLSAGDWTANTKNYYGLRVDTTLEAGEILDFDLGVEYGPFAGKIAGTDVVEAGAFAFTVKPELTFGDIISTNGIETSLAMDFVYDVNKGTSGVDYIEAMAAAMDFNYNLTVNLSEEDDDEDTSNVALDVYYAPGKKIENTPLGTISAKHRMDMKLSFVELDGNDGFVPGLGAEANFKFMNLLDTKENIAAGDVDGFAFEFDAEVSYEIAFDEAGDNTVTPYVGAGYTAFAVDNAANNAKEKATFKAGVDVEGFVKNTTFFAKYEAKDLTDADGASEGAGKSNKGILSLGATVEF